MRLVSQPQFYRTPALPLRGSRCFDGYGRLDTSKVDASLDRDFFERSDNEISLILQPRNGFGGCVVMFEKKR